MVALLLLVSCSAPILPSPAPSGSVPGAPPPPSPLTALSAPPATWTLTGGTSLYTRLYVSTGTGGDVLDLDRFLAREIDDRIITAVAADLVVQFYQSGTNPLYSFEDDLVVWRGKDLVPVLPEELRLGNDAKGEPFDFEAVKEMVRAAALTMSPSETCKDRDLWWMEPSPPPVRVDPEDLYSRCIVHVREIREAVEHELQLRSLRQDLSLIAYGGESVWDGQLTTTGSALRTYDLLLDIASAGNILGSAPFDPLFDRGNQGEQCDWRRCPSCILPASHLCGDSGVQGAEQCDDGNRFGGDGCDEFCQVEGNYCGNAQREAWERCDDEGTTPDNDSSGKECPDGTPCGDFSDCSVGGSVCPYDAPDCEGFWKKTCRWDGAVCGSDSECACPPSIATNPRACEFWRRDSCRYSFDGVCYLGDSTVGTRSVGGDLHFYWDIIEGTRCRGGADCSGISSCLIYATSPEGRPLGFCTGHPYKECSQDEQCFGCSFEEVWGSCFTTGEKCNGNEDCPDGYCVLSPPLVLPLSPFSEMTAGDARPEPVCRPRTRGGYGSTEPSSCNEFCEDVVRCGDRIVYLDGDGIPEECDDGMQCTDGTECARGQRCSDGSRCEPRDGGGSWMDIPHANSCTAECQLQICGDGVDGVTGDQPPEECDTGARCVNGDPCDITNPVACQNKGVCSWPQPDGSPQYCTVVAGSATGTCPPVPSDPGSPPVTNVCNPDFSCAARSDDGDGCSADCMLEGGFGFCGDGSVQTGEECDTGGFCEQGTKCSGTLSCPTAYDYCEGYTNRRCDDDLDCPSSSRCVPANGSPACTAASNDGDSCDANCKREFCGDGTLQDRNREECDDGMKCDDGITPCTSDSDCPVPVGIVANGICAARSGDGCSVACRIEPPLPPIVCGDCRIVPPVESCEDGNTTDGDGCSASCELEYCGDGTVQGGLGEQCDDGNNVSGDGCSGGCLNEPVPPPPPLPPIPPPPIPPPPPPPSRCGDGNVNGSEDCDPGSKCVGGTNDGANCSSDASVCSGGGFCQIVATDPVCTASCRAIVCGDCRVDAPQESCEDGNTASGDGCDASCHREGCGDGITQAGLGEECDDGGKCADGSPCSTFDPNACPNLLLLGRCVPSGGACWNDSDCASSSSCTGPGTPPGCIQTFCNKGKDTCRKRACDGCGLSCKQDRCGNEITECGEECDDNDVSGDGCTGVGDPRGECLIEFCGDGVRDGDGPDNVPGNRDDEACDDGWGNSDTAPGACRTDCRLRRCGDGTLDSGEECDSPTCPDGTLCRSDADCGIERCLPRDGHENCSGDCRIEGCGDGIVQALYGEQCDDGGVCDGIGTPCTTLSSDADCGAGIICIPEGNDGCSASCQNEDPLLPKINLCGDGYRETFEQCDDGNRVGGDGCGETCALERPDLCGNGIVETLYGEECDQGHPYRTMECTPFCRRPRNAPMCGDYRKDPSGTKRGDLLDPLFTFREGYRLDWRIPEGDQTIYAGIAVSDLGPKGLPPASSGLADRQVADRSAGGWYVTPRVFDRRLETPFLRAHNRGFENERENVLDQSSCSPCGNGVLDPREQCDSGRLSGGAYPAPRVNERAWRRSVWSEAYRRVVSPYYWQWHFGFFPFFAFPVGWNLLDPLLFPTYDEITQYWYFSRWDYRHYWNFLLGPGRWWPTRRILDEQKPAFRKENCSSNCALQLCGNDRIDDGETCDDGGIEYKRRRDGDGCSQTCFLEKGFRFDQDIVWPNGVTQRITCGDDVVSQGEQCDDGGRCIRRDGTEKKTARYCRLEPGRTFCDTDGRDNVSGTGDDEACEPVGGDGCDAGCMVEPPGICGNGILEPYEECDDGMKCDDGKKSCRAASDCAGIGAGTCAPRDGDGCSAQCMFEPAVCGNGILEPLGPDGVFGTPDDEQCDSTAFGCTASCTFAAPVLCGNGTLDSPEQCDEGSGGNSNTEPNTCRVNCLRPFCGDGVQDREEECDDPADPLCENCLVRYCGNSRVDPGETCDPPAAGTCSTWCLMLNVCGNAEIEAGEQCDDGNDWSSDGCSGKDAKRPDGTTPSICQWEYCGDGIPQPGLGEECDDGNDVDNDACRMTCRLPACGDDIKDDVTLQSGVQYTENCDPGKHCVDDPTIACKSGRECTSGQCLVLDTPTCAANCTRKPKCGDGETHGEEECDPPGAGCLATCDLEYPELCGNGRIGYGEECDDGNNADHDGCTETCQIEEVRCPPGCILDADHPECASQCVFGRCGNGAPDIGEQCDDGRHCQENPDDECDTHADCELLCLPTSGDGCSSDCMLELAPGDPEAVLTLCQEEVSSSGYGGRIGTGQVLKWRETLLDPDRNPFISLGSIGSARFLGARGGAWWSYDWEWWNPAVYTAYLAGAWPWYWGSAWWPSSWYAGWYGYFTGWSGWWGGWMTQCTQGKFPNSVGNLVQYVAGCLQSVAQMKAMPDRAAIMPFQPTGITSYPACQEPRAQLVSAVEIPPVPAIEIPPYVPSQLVSDLTRMICGESGWPRRAFMFLCNEPSEPADPVRLSPPFPPETPSAFLAITQYERQSAILLRELLLAHALDAAYRAGETVLSGYLQDAFAALTQSLDTALRLLGDLQRTSFTDTVCPIDGTPLCPP